LQIEAVAALLGGDRLIAAGLLLKLHWKGGNHTSLQVAKNRVGRTRWTTDVETEALIRDLARRASGS
jgi:hypothetical protein